MFCYNNHVHCLDNHTSITAVKTEAHESSLYAQGSTTKGLSDFKPVFFHDAR